MANSSTTMTALPTRIDRYPAKMISYLAERLVSQYASHATHLLDPFCGSGAVIRSGSARNIRTTGIDINPFGVLLSSVKVQGFDPKRAYSLYADLEADAKSGRMLPVDWDMKEYWFTAATLRKLECIRATANAHQLYRSKAGRAVLLALGLSARLCSRADQRSPKPFISRSAREKRSGRHYDPYVTMRSLLGELCDLYGRRHSVESKIVRCDIGDCEAIEGVDRDVSHVITSPPYINAQDYFRNSKLELYLLEGLLPYSVEAIKDRFIGTERGLDPSVLYSDEAKYNRSRVKELRYLERHRRDLAVIVHTYLLKMARAFDVIKEAVIPGGTLIVVCGDNLIGGQRIVTWKILNHMLEDRGFRMFDLFEDTIRNRALAPTRCGHKGLIKQEVVSAFQLEC